MGCFGLGWIVSRTPCAAAVGGATVVAAPSVVRETREKDVMGFDIRVFEQKTEKGANQREALRHVMCPIGQLSPVTDGPVGVGAGVGSYKRLVMQGLELRPLPRHSWKHLGVNKMPVWPQIKPKRNDNLRVQSEYGVCDRKHSTRSVDTAHTGWGG